MTPRYTNNFRRSFTMAACVMASFLLVACGGAGESSSGSRLNETLPYSEQKSGANESPQANPGQSYAPTTGEDLDEQANNTGGSPNGGDSVDAPTTQNPNKPVQTPNEPVQAPNDSVADNDDSAGEGTDANNGGGPNGIIDEVVDPIEDVVDDVSDIALDDELWEGPVARVAGQITLEWFPPRVRENGEALRDGEVGGYELRYRKAGSESFEHVILSGEWTVEHELTNLQGDYQFAVAAFDVDGLYSNFINITPES